MLNIDHRSRVPIYEQIKNQILELVMLGVLEPHERLPSIRSLAKDLNLNVNTVKRAFSDLEAADVIYTGVGRGSFISEQARDNSFLKDKAREEIETAIKNGRSNGLSKDEIISIVDSLYGGSDEDDLRKGD
ncbi:GntR family transcriptional regulator [Dethiobacter alkaliphilus]|uniref:Transcriptional regulator, GntR family n=1 Tax=Dethiobacter alkaliphilus AHT 1 TaxID=555088 RepID=C0GE94_DETAL|nr:GntR family transcriptional regulator [Dethiobacter alkaliphilus]EEG78388.1 transcriptional regulator, GntR family [Dethiobacter alkaliphilus AHT 1]